MQKDKKMLLNIALWRDESEIFNWKKKGEFAETMT